MHKQEIFALDGKCQKKQEIINWVCGFVFFFCGVFLVWVFFVAAIEIQ